MTLRGAAVKGGLLALALRAGDAFRPPSRAAPVRGSPRGLAADPATEAEKLRAQAAKYRAEYEQLSQEMGKAAPPSSDAPAGAAAAPAAREDLLSAEEARALASAVDFAGGDAAAQVAALDGLVASGDFRLWQSAVRRGAGGSTMSKLVPFPVTLGSLGTRTDGKVTGENLGIGGDKEVKFEDFQDLTIAVVLGSTALGILSVSALGRHVVGHC